MNKVIVGGALVLFFGAFYTYRSQNPADTTNGGLVDAGATLKRLTGGDMQTSQAGRDAIIEREGLRDTIYADVAGYLTGGIGHRLTPADGALSVGDVVSTSVIDKWFNDDVRHAENIVIRYTSVPLTQGQFDAFVSAAFNLGSALFVNRDGSDTHFRTALNAGDFNAAYQFLSHFNHAGGVVVAGLTARRQSEITQAMA